MHIQLVAMPYGWVCQLTCVGDTFASRVASSLLHAAGLTQLITYSLEAYENTAMSLAQNKDTLTSIKEKLSTENMTSPLFDTAKFAESLEESYREILKKHAK